MRFERPNQHALVGRQAGHTDAGMDAAGSSASPGTDVTLKAPASPKRRPYRPLDVKSWGEGLRVVAGWVSVTLFAILVGGLSALYETTIINVEDRDVRDMQYDHRITSVSTGIYHKNFINGIACCNSDPVVYPPNEFCGFKEDDVWSNDWLINRDPLCPPTLVFECYIATDTYCNQTRAVVYSSLGLTLTGAYSNCTSAGRMRVGLNLVTPGHQTKLSVLDTSGEPLNTYGYNIFSIGQPSVQAGIQAFVWSALQDYGSNSFLLPSTPLTQAILINGRQATPLSVLTVTNTSNVKRIGRWPVAIFDFPGMNKRCQNTSSFWQFFLFGTVDFALPDFNYRDPTSLVSTLTFLNSTLRFAHWRVQLANSTNITQSANLTNVTVSRIRSIQISVGMVSALGACYAWMADTSPAALNLSYGAPVYVGPASTLNTLDLKGGVVPLNVTVRDVAAPFPLALPYYSGMWYIVVSFMMGAVWMIPTGLFILFVIPLIWWNVRSNNGLAPIVYRYLKSYRGW